MRPGPGWRQSPAARAPVVGIRLENDRSSRVGKVIVGGVALGVAGCVLAISLFRGGVIATRAFYAPVVQVDLPLTPEDDYAAVVRTLGQPAVRALACCDGGPRAINTKLLAYPQRRLYVILMGPDRECRSLHRSDGLELASRARGGPCRPRLQLRHPAAPAAILIAGSLADTILTMKKIAGRIVWALISLAAAFFLAAIAVDRGEPVNSFWIVLAAACTYLVGFRFYARFIAAKVMALDDLRATPAERLRDGHDYEPTNKWILFGHHFAAIAGPGPLVGPTLAAQFGYLPERLLDHHRRGAGRRGTGFRDSVLLHAARRQNARPDGARRDRQSRRLHGAADGAVHHDHPAGGGGAGGGERAEGQPLGDVHHRGDHADRAVHGPLSALLAAGQGAGVLRSSASCW